MSVISSPCSGEKVPRHIPKLERLGSSPPTIIELLNYFWNNTFLGPAAAGAAVAASGCCMSVTGGMASTMNTNHGGPDGKSGMLVWQCWSIAKHYHVGVSLTGLEVT